MFVNAELKLLEEELHQKLHCCNRAVIRPNPLCSFCVKVDFFLPLPPRESDRNFIALSLD